MLLVSLLALLCCFAGHAQKKVEPTVSQINVLAGEGQAAYVSFGMEEKVWSVGADSDGFYIDDGGTSVFSIDLEGEVTVRSDVFSAENFMAERLTLNDVNQWQVAALEMFDSEPPAKLGWFAGETASPTFNCSNLLILTGPRGDLKVANLDSASKYYEKLLKHTHVRIQASAHFIDDWQGETAYLKINDNVVWTDTHDQRASRGQFSVCGSPSYPESRLTVPIDVTFPHKSQKLKVSFGSTLDRTANAMFGLSSLTVSLRLDHSHLHQPKPAPKPPVTPAAKPAAPKATPATLPKPSASIRGATASKSKKK